MYKIDYYSKRNLSNNIYKIKENFIWISIYYSNTQPLKLQSDYCINKLELQFDDISELDDNKILLSYYHCEMIYNFINKNYHIRNIIINCVLGKSRSQSIALCLMKHLNNINEQLIFEFNPPRNMFIYNKLNMYLLLN